MKVEKKSEVRYVGLDLGKRTYDVSIVKENGEVGRSNGQTTVAGRQGLYKKLKREDKVALEAGNLAFIMAKELEASVGCQVYVLNPSHLPIIYSSMKKTDKEDSLKLAHIVSDIPEERLPTVAVPGEEEMRRRKLLSSYERAQVSRTREINQLHGLFLSRGITTKTRSDLSSDELRREAVKELKEIERREGEHLLVSILNTEEWLKELEKGMKEESAGDEEIERLQSVPGVGPKVAFAFVAHVDSDRFENAGQVSNYLGLVPRVYISGDTVRYGRITKRGNGYVRALLVQAAWALTRTKALNKLKARYEYMTKEKSISKKKAIVAIARRLGELLYTLMRDGSRYEARPFVRERKEVEQLAEAAQSA